MLQRVQEKTILRGLSLESGVSLRGALKALFQWAIVDDYDTILDLDCEDTALLRAMANQYSLRACGICTDAERAKSLRMSMPEAEICCARRQDIPWRDQTFNTVLYYMKNSQQQEEGAFLRETLRVLKPGGQLLIAARWTPSAVKSALCALGLADEDDGLNRERLLSRMEESGLRDVSWRVTSPLYAVAMGWKAR